MLTYSQEILADSPVGYWRLGEASGVDAADDAGSNTGTYVNAPTLGVTGAVVGNTAVTFSQPSSQYVTIGDANPLDLGDIFTIEFFINVPAGGGFTIIDKQLDAYCVDMNGLAMRLLKQGAAVLATTSGAGNLVANTWAHIAWTKSGAAVKYYKDGVDQTPAISNATMSDNASPLLICRKFDGVNHFTGTLDEVALYPTALSPARIAAHYAARNSTGSDTMLPMGMLGTGRV